ncbi:hypothetical protein, partial [Rhizobium phaseoli]
MTRLFAAALLALTATACQTQQQTAALECGANEAFLVCKLAGGSDEDCAHGHGAAAIGAAT